MANLLANSLHTEQRRSNINIHLESCLCPPDESKTKIHFTFSSVFNDSILCSGFFLAFSLKSAAAVTEKSAMSVVRVNQNNKVAGCKIKTMR